MQFRVCNPVMVFQCCQMVGVTGSVSAKLSCSSFPLTTPHYWAPASSWSHKLAKLLLWVLQQTSMKLYYLLTMTSAWPQHTHMKPIILFKSITWFCGTNSILRNIFHIQSERENTLLKCCQSHITPIWIWMILCLEHDSTKPNANRLIQVTRMSPHANTRPIPTTYW